MPGPCPAGQALLEAMGEALGANVSRPVDEIEDPALRAVAASLGHRWREHFLGCAACRRVWVGMAVQVGHGRNADWRSAALFVEEE